MNDKDRTNYFRKKLSDMKEASENSIPEFAMSPTQPTTTQEVKPSVVQKFFHTAFTFLAFYGAQYIILNKYVSPGMTLNFFEAGVIFLCLTSILARRS